MSSAKVEIEKFNGTGDYMLWREKICAHLELLGYHAMISKDIPDLDEKILDKKMTEDEAEAILEKYRKARSAVVLCLENNVLRKVIKQKSAYKMLLQLDEMFMSKSLTARIHLKQKLFGYSMNPAHSVERNVDEFLKIIADLENVDVAVSDEDQALMLLMALPNQYNSLKDTLRYNKKSLTLDEVISAIQSKELDASTKVKESQNSGDGLFVRGKSYSKNDKPDKHQKNSNKGKKGKKDKSKIVCYECGEKGHYKSQCTKVGKRTENQGDAAFVNGVAGCRTDVLMVNDVMYVGQESLEQSWVVDSGCSFHMTWNRSWFSDLDENQVGSVRMANNTEAQVRGIGSVKLVKPDGSSLVLTKVRYVPGIKRNLISLGTLEALGCSYHSENGILQVCKEGVVMFQARREETLYFLLAQPEIVGTVAQVSHNTESAGLWHSRMGHMSQKGLELLRKRGLIKNLKEVDRIFCENCVFGKNHMLSFHKATHDSRSVLEYVHTDLWGSSYVPKSLGGA